MLWQEAARVRKSSSKVVKSWAISEDSTYFVLSTLPPVEEEPVCGADPSPGEEDEVQEVPDLIALAQAQAQEISDQAYREGYEQGEHTGYEAGYEKGFSLGRSDGLARADETYRQALGVLRGAEEGRREILARLEPEIVKVAVAIAEKIICTQLTLEEQTIAQITQKALSVLVAPRWVNIYAHPKDAEALMKNKKILAEKMGENVPVQIRKNADLPPGSCFLESDKGTLDASVTTQMGEIKKILEIA